MQFRIEIVEEETRRENEQRNSVSMSLRVTLSSANTLRQVSEYSPSIKQLQIRYIIKLHIVQNKADAISSSRTFFPIMTTIMYLNIKEFLFLLEQLRQYLHVQ